jgi:hypothetical protein
MTPLLNQMAVMGVVSIPGEWCDAKCDPADMVWCERSGCFGAGTFPRKEAQSDTGMMTGQILAGGDPKQV